MPQIGELANGIREASKLGGTRFMWLFPIGVLLDSIIHLSQLETFQLLECHKLEKSQMEFGKLQNVVEVDLSGCS
jgi:hypothetical protein